MVISIRSLASSCFSFARLVQSVLLITSSALKVCNYIGDDYLLPEVLWLWKVCAQELIGSIARYIGAP